MSMLKNEELQMELREDGSRRVFIGEFSESCAKQAFKDECDINTILRRHRINLAQPVPLDPSHFGDVSNVTDFRDAMEIVIKGEQEFSRLPARIRAEFDHDPLLFIDAFNDPDNADYLRELGLLKPLPVTPEAGEDGSSLPPQPDSDSAGGGA